MSETWVDGQNAFQNRRAVEIVRRFIQHWKLCLNSGESGESNES